jgi:leucyl-tRNA synthetase
VQLEAECYTGEGTLVNSGEYNFMDTAEARKHITADFGVLKVQYKLRDWVFSRQRYWGEPIPLIHCAECGVVPVPEDQLPVTLPEVEKYEPTGTGESPLAAIESWVKTTCPQCQGPVQRETNTMPQWAGSSWYFLRYADPQNSNAFAAPDKLKYWQPVDVYFGGMEHTTLHLLYARFWNQFLHDIGVVPQSEPFQKRVPHGIILGPDGEKMSKSRGNVVNPDEIIEKYGADTLRMYKMFLGPHGDVVAWNDNGVVGVRRFLERVNNLMPVPDQPAVMAIHKLIKKITDDLQVFKFNTCISAFMEFLNNNPALNQTDLKVFVKLLAPFAPHMAEELWQTKLGQAGSVHLQPWPEYDKAQLAEDTVTIAVQVMGKTRATIQIKTNATQEEVQAAALSDANVSAHMVDKQIIKSIFVPNRLINFVIQ